MLYVQFFNHVQGNEYAPALGDRSTIELDSILIRQEQLESSHDEMVKRGYSAFQLFSREPTHSVAISTLFTE